MHNGNSLTDDAAPEPRATFDVDAIVEITSYARYTAFSERLGKLGFAHDTREGAPICRWVHGTTTVDVMPRDSKILGFSNQWYRDAMKASGTFMLPAGIVIRTTTAPYFIATKLEAFKSRGKRDFLGSHDLEDILTVVDGRATLADEVRAESQELRAYLGREIGRLLATPAFLDALPGHLFPDAASQARIHLILERLGELAAIK